MTIASGSTPTGGTHIQPTEFELESGLRPSFPRTVSARSGRSHRSFPFPGASDCGPPVILTTIPSADSTTSPRTPTDENPRKSNGEEDDQSRSPNRHYLKSNHTQSRSTFTNSTFPDCNSSDPDYQKTVFDYRVLSPSMHSYRHIAIFRRFGRLSMSNMLYYQQELQQLEDALRDLDHEEARWHLTGNGDMGGAEEALASLKESRHKIMRSLRETLKNYYEALLLQDQIFTSLEPPRHRDSTLLHEVSGSAAGQPSPFHLDEHRDDLVALGLGERDSLEKTIGRLVPALFPHRNPSVEDVWSRGMRNKDVASIFSPFTRRITRLVIALLTSAAMLLPMCLLTLVGNGRNGLKLGLVAVFTFVLAIGIAIGTRGKGETIVMQIAAYAAVLVVFVSEGNPLS